MKIRHERPMSDLEYKVRAPLRLELQTGEVVDVHEWSQRGLTYPVKSDVLPKKGYLIIPFQGVDLRFDVAFKKGDGPQDLLFKDLTGRQREVIGVFYRAILSGKMAPSDDIITALDTPVDLVPMGETEEEEAAGKSKTSPRALRVVWNVVFYALLATALVGLIGGQVWGRLSSVQIKNARVVAPIVSHHALGPAYVDQILVVPGQQVRRGDTLIRMTNPQKDGNVDDIRRDIIRAAKRTRAARAVLQTHLANYEKELADLVAAYQYEVRIRSHRDFLVGYNLQQVLTAYFAMKRFQLRQTEAPGDFHDIAAQLRTQLEDAKEEERRLKRDLGNAKSDARSYDIVALENGVVNEVHVLPDIYVSRGADMIQIEENTQRTVQGWVSEARAAAVHVGMPSEIRVPSREGLRTYKGEITDIVAGIDPVTDAGYGMIVTISLNDMSVEDSRSKLLGSAPVKAQALKSWHRSFWWP